MVATFRLRIVGDADAPLPLPGRPPLALLVRLPKRMVPRPRSEQDHKEEVGRQEEGLEDDVHASMLESHPVPTASGFGGPLSGKDQGAQVYSDFMR